MPNTPKNKMPRIPVLQPYGIIGYDPYASSVNSSDPYPAFAANNAFYLDPSFRDLVRITSTSSADGTSGACRNFLSIKDDSDDIDDSTPATLDDALRKMKETLRKTNEVVRKIKAEFKYFKDVDSESDSSNSDTDPEIKAKIDRRNIAERIPKSSSNSDIGPKIAEIDRIMAERFGKKSKSKVPVQTESLSRASPNWNPLHEENENNDFHTDHENDGLRGRDPADSDNTTSEIIQALQEVAIESKGLSDETIASFRLSKLKGSFSSRSKKPSDNYV